MTTYYVDLEDGSDANTGLGWEKVNFTGGTSTAPAVGNTITGNDSSASGKVISYTGSWGTSGIIYLYNTSGTFNAGETMTLSTGGTCTNSGGGPTNCAKNTVNGCAPAGSDVIRLLESALPTSAAINGTFTNGSKTITLVSALTASIQDCDEEWSVYGDITSSISSSYYKFGAASTTITIPSEYTTGEIAWTTTESSSMNLSAYGQLSFWIRAECSGSSSITSGSLKINLYSTEDASGTPVDTFLISDTIYPNRWVPLTIARTGAGALGSSISSISIEIVNALTIDATIYLNNMIAVKAASSSSSLSLRSLIGTNAVSDTWYPIQSIDGTTVLIDLGVDTNANIGQGYAGATTTTTVYKREPIALTSSDLSISYSGTETSRITVGGGWSKTTNTQTGETWVDGSLGNAILGMNVTSRNFIDYLKIGISRFSTGLSFITSNDLTFSEVDVVGCDNNIYFKSCTKITGDDTHSVCSSSAGMESATFTTAGKGSFNIIFSNSIFRCNGTYGSSLTSSHDIKFNSCEFGGNTTSSFLLGETFTVYTFNSLLADAVEYTLASTTRPGSFLAQHRYQQVAGRYKTMYSATGSTPAGIISDHYTAGYDNTDDDFAYGGSGNCVVLNPLQTTSTAGLEYSYIFPVESDIEIQVKFYVKKSASGSNCTLSLTIYDTIDEFQKLLNGESVTLTDAWVQYTSPAFTPSDKAFCKLILKAVDGSPSGDIGIDSFSKINV
jgi:hypothetical protein